MIIYRDMEPRDKEQVVALGLKAHEESIYGVIEFSEEKSSLLFDAVVYDAYRCSYVAEKDGVIVGLFLGSLCDYPYGFGIIASDNLVYVNAEHRGSGVFKRLVDRYFAWAKNAGATVILLSQTSGINVDRTEGLYTKLGMAKVGTRFAYVTQEDSNG